MQVELLHAGNIPPRATSSTSSYHTVLDCFATPTGSVESLTSSSSPTDSEASSPPSSPGLEYETIKRQRNGTALVIQHPTLVNFVPTSDIQTAVSISADRIVIDTILPPTATLRANNLAYRPTPHSPTSHSQQVAEFSVQGLLKKHKEELYRTLTTKLTENYDPTGSIKDDVFTTLTQLTRFPDPVGTNRSKYVQGQCPCICCEVGCSNPLEPYSTTHTTSVGTSSISSLTLSSQSKSAGVQGSHSFLEMNKGLEDRSGSIRGRRGDGSKFRFGFLTLGRFGRSQSQTQLVARTDSVAKRISMDAIPVPAPAISENVTAQVMAPQAKVSHSRSFSDLVRRRRNKHMAATSTQAIQPLSASTSSFSGEKAKARKDDEELRLPVRSSSHTNLVDSSASAVGKGRYSEDRAWVDTPFKAPQAPQPPPRRSSKMYAIIGRKPIPQLNLSSTTSNLHTKTLNHPQHFTTMPQSARSIYGISQIIEEDEDLEESLADSNAGRDANVSSRHSALMSSYQPKSYDVSYDNGHSEAVSGERRNSVDVAQGWTFRTAEMDRVKNRHFQGSGKAVEVREETQIGVAI